MRRENQGKIRLKKNKLKSAQEMVSRKSKSRGHGCAPSQQHLTPGYFPSFVALFRIFNCFVFAKVSKGYRHLFPPSSVVLPVCSFCCCCALEMPKSNKQASGVQSVAGSRGIPFTATVLPLGTVPHIDCFYSFWFHLVNKNSSQQTNVLVTS